MKLHNLFLEQVKQYTPTKDDISKFNYPSNVGSMGAKNSSEWYEKMSSMMLNELEVLKIQKMGKGIEYCKPCELSVTGTIKGDIESEKICVNKSLYYKKWECPEGYGTYSVMMKEYGTSDWKVLTEMTKKLPTTKYVDPFFEFFKDPHNILTTLEIVTAFIPVYGIFISAGFGLANAELYYEEGKKQDAALSLFFAILPGLGHVGAKIVGNMSAKGLENLSEKLIKNGLTNTSELSQKFLEKNASKFNVDELNVLQKIVDNEVELKKMSKILTDKKQLSKVVSNIKNKTKSSLTDIGVNLSGVPVGLSAYPLYKKLNPGVREKLEKMGINFDELKLKFGSSGSKEDNLLMLSALNSGWTPDQPIPEKYQTKNTKYLLSMGVEHDIEVTELYNDLINIYPELNQKK